MKTLKTTILFAFISVISYSQMNFEPSYSNGYSSITASMYTSNRYSIGAEVRAEWDWFYMGFYAEALNENKGFEHVSLIYDVGASVGVFQNYNNFMFLQGIKLGKISKDGDLKTSYGLEAEIDYIFNDGFFIGIKGNFNKYNHGETKDTVETIDYSRVFLKIGFRF